MKQNTRPNHQRTSIDNCWRWKTGSIGGVKWERRKACLRLSFELRKESCCVKMMIMKEYVHVNTWIHLAMASSVSIGWNCRSCCQSISCCCSGAQPDGNMAMMKKCAATMGNKMANVKQQSQSLSNHAKLEKARREDDILTGDLCCCGANRNTCQYMPLFNEKTFQY